MDLVQSRSARQRNDLVLRLGCWMVTLSMVCSLVIQPPKAKAIAIADDAVVAAVILSVMAYGGYKLWVDNLDASAIADIIKPHVKQWNYEHGSSAEDPFSGFAEWATGGMDKFRKSITPIPGGPGPDMNGISWVLSFALFDKVCQFAEWLGNRVGAKPGVAEPVPVPSAGNLSSLSNLSWTINFNDYSSYFSCTLDSNSFVARATSESLSTSTFQMMIVSNRFTVPVSGDYTFRFRGTERHSLKDGVSSSPIHRNTGQRQELSRRQGYCQPLEASRRHHREFSHQRGLRAGEKAEILGGLLG